MAFPNFKGKHKKDSMINPKDYIAYVRGEKLVKGGVPEAMIICYNNRLMKHSSWLQFF